MSRSDQISGNRTNREQRFARITSRGLVGTRSTEYSTFLFLQVNCNIAVLQIAYFIAESCLFLGIKLLIRLK